MESAMGIGSSIRQRAWQANLLVNSYHAKSVDQVLGRSQPALLHAREYANAVGSQGASNPLRISVPRRSRFQSLPGGILSARVLSEDRVEPLSEGEEPGCATSDEDDGTRDGKLGPVTAASDAVFAAIAGVNGNVLAASDALVAALAGVGNLQPERVAQNISEWRYSIQQRFAFTSILRALTGRMQESPGASVSAGVVPREDEEIEAVTADDLDPLVQWEQRKKDVIAEKERPTLTSPGFSFSAAGLLFPYHLGVCKCLLEHGYITENTPLAGSSAGALVCAVVAGGVSMDEAMAATRKLAEDCRASGTVFRLGGVLRSSLEDFLPEDVHLRVNGRIRVAITQVFRRPRGLLVDKFDSKEDLINALFTSCFVPGYLAPRPVTVFRDRFCIDGGISLFVPPTAAESTVRVCAFPSKAFGLRGIEISPDCNPSDSRPSAKQLLNWALEPPSDDILDDLFSQGEMDALTWVRKTEQAQRSSLEAQYHSS